MISLPRRALSAMEIVNVLVEEGYPSNSKTLAFAQEKFDSVESKALSGLNLYQPRKGGSNVC